MTREDLHAADRKFLKHLPKASNEELLMLLQFQAQERWKRIALEREMERRWKRR